MAVQTATQLLVIFSIFFLEGNAGPFGPTVGPTVDTSSGRVIGLYTDTAQVFRSIPYARPPVGELRWKDPLRPFPVPGIISATEDPPGCPQQCHLPLSQYTCPKRISEDCLYLNIFAPLNATSTSKIPVLLFIHGGNFLRGYGGGRLYDGQYFANTTNTVFVSINYRVGALGFLVYEEGEDMPQGNFGIRDQRLAFQWVQENIEGFGGDPSQVTIWGQSAGATSVAVHLTSIRSAGLFDKAIIESNPFGITLKDMQKARKLGEAFAEELDCKDIACLRNQNINDIAEAQERCLSKIIDAHHIIELFMQWTPVVDYIDLLDQPMYLMGKGQVPKIPILMGSTSEETIIYVYEAYTSPVSKSREELLEFAFFPYAYKKVHDFYPAIPGDDQRPNIAAMGTDFTFTCTNRYAMVGMANMLPLWVYDFNHSASFDGWGKHYEYCNGHSCHGIDLPFLFHGIQLGNFTPTMQEVDLSVNMTKYWTNFAHRGDPNDFGVNPSVPYWPQYNVDENGGTEQSKCMRFKTPRSEVILDYDGKACRFWDSVGYDV